MSKDKKNFNSSDQEWKSYLGLGLNLALIILFFTGAGYWLDGKFESSPLWTLVLALFGLVGGFYKFFLEIKRLENKKKSKE